MHLHENCIQHDTFLHWHHIYQHSVCLSTDSWYSLVYPIYLHTVWYDYRSGRYSKSTLGIIIHHRYSVVNYMQNKRQARMSLSSCLFVYSLDGDVVIVVGYDVWYTTT